MKIKIKIKERRRKKIISINWRLPFKKGVKYKTKNRVFKKSIITKVRWQMYFQAWNKQNVKIKKQNKKQNKKRSEYICSVKKENNNP